MERTKILFDNLSFFSNELNRDLVISFIEDSVENSIVKNRDVKLCFTLFEGLKAVLMMKNGDEMGCVSDSIITLFRRFGVDDDIRPIIIQILPFMDKTRLETISSICTEFERVSDKLVRFYVMFNG